MASSSGPSLNEELQCSICLEVFTDPVTTPCGHNFCRTCLIKCWTNTQTCFCPLCNEKFSKRPDLKINTTLREVVQHFKEKLNPGESEVFCDFCDERKQKAVTTCLMCQSSYCETHLEPHHRVPRLKKHTLINAVENLEDYICQKHERPLELFCRDDQTCVCLSCTEGEHRTHNTVPIEEESREKKNQLVQTQIDVHQMIQDRMKKIQEIQHSVELRKRNTEEEKSSSVEIFTDLIRSIERRQSDLLKMMEEQQKAAEKQAEDLIKELHQEITELKRRNTELEQLSQTEDHLHLIQMSSSLYSRPHTKNWTEIRIDSEVNSLKRALTELKKTLDETLNEKISQTVDVTLDPDTANPRLILSDDGKQVSHGDVKQDVPENPKRFDVMIQDRTKKIPEIKHSVEQRKTLASNDCFLPSLRPVHISKWMIISLGVLLVSALMILILPKQYTTSEWLKFAQKFAVDVTLDPDTANPYLILSDDGKQVSHGDVKQDVPENPKRFDFCVNILAKQGFSSGRFYYEVQVKGKTDWTLGVIRESIYRKGIRLRPKKGFWTVALRNENEYLVCESPPVSLSLRVKPEKVGVFVDYEEGLVSFYDVESRSHIYSFTGQTFTEKLYPYFSPGDNDEGKNSNPLIITPVRLKQTK
ncbi:E3 ubiquitin-protein ligase TRIM39-like isoform X2 [Siphateles boraxobius]|uniref:E3 ubiquitin-protein ligase TRIM39-like isoform X2 n=1 Tax=Siphateles boraxobius TaxID=180520 RepID=UPI004062A329